MSGPGGSEPRSSQGQPLEPALCSPRPPLRLPANGSRLPEPAPIPPEVASRLRRGRAVVRTALEGLRRSPNAPGEAAAMAHRAQRALEGADSSPAGPIRFSISPETHLERVLAALGRLGAGAGQDAARIVIYDRFFSVERDDAIDFESFARSCARGMAAMLGELPSAFLRREHHSLLLVAVETALDVLLGPGAGSDREDAPERPDEAPGQGAGVTEEELWRRRWVCGHWGFFVLTQFATSDLVRASRSVEAGDQESAAAATLRATRLIRGTTAALALASDISPEAYGGLLRPLMREAGGERGFTGDQSLDRHFLWQAFNGVHARVRPLGQPSPPLLEALRSLKDTVRFEAIEHALAARAVVGHLPSLVMEDSRRPVSAVDVLLEMARHRNEMFRYLDPPPAMPNYPGTQPPGSGGPPASPGRPT